MSTQLLKNVDRKWIIVAIVVLGSILRLWNVGNVPPSPSLDEATIGWNAYSLVKTGMDEYATHFPILLRAYDDYRPALYVYLVAPFISLFGLTVFSVRLPSVLLSILSIYATYKIILTLPTFIKENKKKWFSIHSESIALFASLFLAISPWHIYISRLGHEVNAGLAFLIFALLFFFRKSFIISTLFFCLSFMSYQSEKIVVPLIMFTLAVLFYKELLERKKQIGIAVCIGLVLTVPFLVSSLKPDALIRFEGTNILASYPEKFTEEALKRKESIDKGDIVGTIIHNRRVVAAEIIASQYFSHFNPYWLLTNTGREAHKIPTYGILLWWEALSVIIGLYVIAKKYIPVKMSIVLLALIFTAPLPAAITTGAPHAMRSFTAVPAVQILAALGLVFLFIRFKRTTLITSLVCTVISLAFISRNYFIVFPIEQSDSFQYSLTHAISYVEDHDSKYEKIVFSNEDALYQSYMFYLFNSRYDPSVYQIQGGTISGGYDKTHAFGKYEFRPIYWPTEDTTGNTLYVGNIDDFPQDISAVATIDYLNGIPSIVIVDRKNNDTK